MSRRLLYWLAGVAVAVEVVTYVLWRRGTLRRRATSDALDPPESL